MTGTKVGAERCRHADRLVAPNGWKRSTLGPRNRRTDRCRPWLSTAAKRSPRQRATMYAMDISDPTSRRADVNGDTLSEVATLVRAAVRLANAAAGQDLRSPWLDVLAEAVTAAGYLEQHPDRENPADGGSSDDAEAPVPSVEEQTLTALERAAHVLDHSAAHGGHDLILVRAALTDAIDLARRLQA
jgi:hypothetical protein